MSRIPMYDGIEVVSNQIMNKMRQGFELSEMERRIVQTTIECMFVQVGR